MAINVTYGDVAAYGALGAAAGQAAAERTAQEQLLQVQEAQANRRAQAETQLTMQENQQAFAREMAQFDTFIKKEQIQQEHAWTVEEQDIRRRHDLEMQLNEEDFKYDMDLQEWARKNSLRQRKLEALEQARKDGVIDGEEQYNSLKLALELDVEPYPESLGLAGRGGGATNAMNELIAQSLQGGQTPAGGAAPEKFIPGQTPITPENIAGILGQPENIKALAAMPNPDYYPSSDILTPSGMTLALSNILPVLPMEQRGKLQAVLATGNSDLIAKAFEAVKSVEPIPGDNERRARIERNLASWNRLPANVGRSNEPARSAKSAPARAEIPAGASYAQVRSNLPGWVSELSPLHILETMDELASGKTSDEVYALVKKRGWLRK